MKSSRPAVRRPPPRGLLFAGYGGSIVLVLAAVAVLLLPLLDQGRGGAAAAGAQPGRTGQPGGAPPAASGAPPPSGLPSGPGQPSGGGQPTGRGGQGGEMPLPGFGGGTNRPCADGVGTVRQAGTELRVVVQVSGTAITQVEVHLRGQTSLKKNARLSHGRPHTFVFPDVPAGQVERVELRTVGTMVPQTCDLPLG
jgi:hypothetical protein